MIKSARIYNISVFNRSERKENVKTIRTLNPTLEFVCRSYDSEYIHVDFGVLGVLFPHPSPHSEYEVARWEAVSTQRVTERVLRSEA